MMLFPLMIFIYKFNFTGINTSFKDFIDILKKIFYKIMKKVLDFLKVTCYN